MSKQLNAEAVREAILQWPCQYQTPTGAKFKGMPVSQVPSQLRSVGWRNVSRLDEYDLRKMGLVVVEARYVGGARPKRFCRVVVAKVGDV
jgi:hypothetical protein